MFRKYTDIFKSGYSSRKLLWSPKRGRRYVRSSVQKKLRIISFTDTILENFDAEMNKYIFNFYSNYSTFICEI